MSSEERAENARALDGSGGREHPSLPQMEIKPRTPVLFMDFGETRSGQHPC